ncbi:MAG: FixH family protein [Saprospiraceae bacterium]
MNWGYKILFVIILFVVGMVGMVIVAFKQSNEMLDTNYYERELQYQQLIDASARLNQITKAEILVENENGWQIILPDTLLQSVKSCKVEFVNLNEKKHDKMFTFNNLQQPMSMLKSQIQAGKYTVRISIDRNGELYYREQQLLIT